MKYLKSGIVTLFCALTFSLNAQTNVIDEIIWIIGDEIILRSEVEEQRLRMQLEGVRIEGDPFCIIPEDIALQRLLLNQARIDSIVESPSAVNSQVEHRINFLISQIGSRERVEEYFGRSIISIREELSTLIEQQMIAQRVRQRIVGDIRVTPAEVRTFFEQMPAEEIPIIPERVEIQIITIEPQVSVEATEAVKAELRSFRQRVESGETDFSTLAILFSEDTQTARRGGELGFVGRGMLVPEFANAAFNLTDTRRVSPIVETEFGLHIIQLIERRGDRINVRHILKRPRISFDDRAEALARLGIISDSIRAGEITFEDAVRTHSADRNTRMNAGLMVNPSTGNSRFQLADPGLPPEIARVIANLNVGEVSAPFILSSMGREIYAVVKLNNRIPTNTANLNDDYQEIQTMLLERRGQEALSRWIERSQQETYIWIKEGWRNCDFRYPGWMR